MIAAMHNGPKPYDWKELFLAELRLMPVISHAARVAGIDRTMVHKTRERHEDFKLAMDEAMEEGIDRAEAEMMRRAVAGVRKPVIHKGQLTYQLEPYIDEDGKEQVRYMRDENGALVPLTTQEYSDGLLQFALKGRRRGVYGDKTEVTGDGGGPLKFMDETKKASRIAALLELARTRKDIG